MIVRNEAKFLAACLQSITDLVGEIVVVDTGSTDDTVAIAQAFGTRVSFFPWRDDFAAARNHAIEQASGDRLLYIDADERVRPCDRTAILTDLDAPHRLAATVEFRPRTGFTAYRETRLLRRDPRIRFHGAMHETFLPDLERLEHQGMGVTGNSRLAIDHVGYDGDQSHKFERNLRLLSKQIEADPERSYLRWHQGAVLAASGQPEAAEAAWLAGAQIVRNRPRRKSDDVMCHIDLIKLYLSQGRDASALLVEGLALQPGNWLLHWLHAKTLAAAGAYLQAIAIHERLAAVDAATLVDAIAYDARIFGAWACAEIAHIAFQQADYATSAAWYGRAEARAPGCQEFRIKRRLATARA